MAEILSDKQRSAAMADLAGWQRCEGRDAICKTFKFKDFRAAFAWMTNVAMKAEKIDHHPDWLNVYNKVEVTLTTHSANGVTALDIELAGYMDAAAR